jgi:hypothetical protein
MKKISVLCFVLLCLAIVFRLNAQSLKPESKWWMPNGTVQTLVKDTSRNLIYLGGGFTNLVTPYSTPYGAIFDTSSLNPMLSDAPDGEVRTVISDGEGGWFIGGGFTSVGGKLRNRIAHINPDGKVSDKILESGFNGNVNSLLKIGNKLYVGGGFDTFGFSQRFYGIIDQNLGYPTKKYPQADGSVYTSVSDGNGGWYIGGSFTKVGDSLRNNAAHIDADGRVTGWSPNLNSRVNSIVIFNGRIFIGGQFTTVAGQTRNYLTEVNNTKGGPVGLNFNVTGQVRVLKVNNGSLFVGGSFTHFGGLARPNLAVFNLITNTVLPTRLLSCNGSINALQVSNDKIYFGGTFTTVNSVTRTRLAALDTASNLLSWSPTSGGAVEVIEYDQGRVFVGGTFNVINGLTNGSLAVLDTNTGAFHVVSPPVSGFVYGIGIVGDKIYIGTSSLLSNGQTKRGLVAYDRQSLAIHQSNDYLCDVAGSVYTIVESGNSLFVGGSASAVGYKYRKGAACIDLSKKLVNFWNPTITSSGAINTMLKSDSGIYLGGNFTAINSTSRGRIAEVDTLFGGLLSWNPNANSDVSKITEIENKLYIAGSFSTIFGQTRNRVAMLSKTTRLLTPWSPNVSSTVEDIDGIGNRLFLIGSFTTVNGVARSQFAELDTLGTGTLQAFYPFTVSPDFNTVKVIDGRLYLGCGLISSGVMGKYRSGVVIFNLSTNQLSDFTMNISTSGAVNTFASYNGKIYTGGTYSSIGILKRENFAALDASTGMPIDWEIVASNAIRSMALKYDKLWLAGAFKTIDGNTRWHLACYNLSTRTLLGWNPNASGFANKIVVDKGKVFVGGEFTTVGGISRNYIAEVDTLQGIPTSWNPNASAIVYELSIIDSTLYVGGLFTTISSQARSNIASFQINTGLITTWNPFANGAVRSIIPKNGLVYVGGNFTTIGGQNRNRLAALDKLSGLATAWNPNMNNSIMAIHLYDSTTAIVSGEFTTAGGLTRSKIASIDLLTGAVKPWNLSFSQLAYCFEQNGKSLFAGGAFTSIGGNPIKYFTALVDSCNFYKANFTSSTYQVCQGDSIALLPNQMENNNYRWFFNNSVLNNDTSAVLYAKVAGSYKVIINNGVCTDTSANITLSVNPRPVTSAITGSTSVLTNSVQPYSVINTTGSMYYWFVNSGLQTNGGNTNAIQVTWGNNNAQASLKVIELASNGCKGDTVLLTGINITPVKWLDFNARYLDEKNVHLTWRTASERNNKMFEVERSNDNLTYTKIGEVAGNRTTNTISSYSMIDSDLKQNIGIYYRIKQIDFNGNFEYSKVVYLVTDAVTEETSLSVSPNPVQDKITVDGFDDYYEIYDVLGNCVVSKTHEKVLDVSKLKQGVYYITSNSRSIKFVRY